MQRMLGLMRKAIHDYDMIRPGDKILVGLSGGKDSVVLLTGLARLRHFLGVDFQVEALTLDMGFGGVRQDLSQLEALCQTLEVPYTIKATDIGPIIFDQRQGCAGGPFTTPQRNWAATRWPWAIMPTTRWKPSL